MSVTILPIRDQETYEEVRNKAYDNGHEVLQPTHMVVKDGEIIGAFSIQVSCASWWMNEGKAKNRDSLQAFQGMEAIMADRGIASYIMPCEKKSTYWELMQRMGYKIFKGEWGIFHKQLT